MTAPNTKEPFTNLTLITQACHAILNTTFSPLTPKPDWYDSLLKNLGAAQANAKDWIDDLAPSVSSSVPTGVVNYGNDYAAFAEEIQSIANAHPDAQGADNQYVKQVHSLVSALESQVTIIIASAGTSSTKLETWGDEMQASHNALTEGANSIQKLEVSLQADITNMNSAMSNLRTQIRTENEKIAKDKTELGFGIAMIIGGVLLAPFTAGTSLLVAGVGGYLTAAGDIGWHALQAEINKQFTEIAKDQSEKADDQRQIIALQGLANATYQAVGYINTSSEALSALRTTWDALLSELGTVKKDLELADKQLSVITEDAFAQASMNEWADATELAQSLLDLTITVDKKDLPMDSNPS